MSFSAKTNAKWNAKETQSKLTKSFEVTIPYETFTTWANENRESKVVKGFRQGHAPLSYFKDDWLLACARMLAQDLIKENKFENVYDSTYTLQQFELGKDVQFLLNVELYPEVPEIKFEDIKLTQHVAKITKADTEAAIKKFGEMNHKPVELAKPRAAQMGDYLNVSVEITDAKGRKEKMNEMEIQLGTHTFLPEIEQKLVGMDIGASLTHDFTIPATGTLLKDQSLVGQEIKITFKINKIRGQENFSQADTFAHFGVNSLAELEARFETEMTAETIKHTQFLLKETLKQELLKHFFEIPMEMLQRKYIALRNQMLNDIGFKEGMDLEPLVQEKLNLNMEDFEKRAIFIAEAMARITFLVMHFSRTLNVGLSNAEVDDAIAAQKKMFPNGLQEAVRFFEEHPEAKTNLTNALIEDKVFKTLSAKCKLETKEHSLTDFYQVRLSGDVAQEALEGAKKAGKAVAAKEEGEKPAKKPAKKDTAKDSAE